MGVRRVAGVKKKKDLLVGLLWWSSGKDSMLAIEETHVSIPGQGMRSHMSQRTIHMLPLKLLNAAVKIEDPHVPQLRAGAAK